MYEQTVDRIAKDWKKNLKKIMNEYETKTMVRVK